MILYAVKHTGIKDIHTTVILVIIKVRENRMGNQEGTIQTPTILGTQYTEQRLEKTKGQSSMDNPDTDNTGYTIHRTKISENRRGNQE